ncbi:MAG TPA: hypothetical protein VFS00_05930, partial [Polyangiaceae bacterium]|nr:hypothetical protein [Polyangiaceae bacterium]
MRPAPRPGFAPLASPAPGARSRHAAPPAPGAHPGHAAPPAPGARSRHAASPALGACSRPAGPSRPARLALALTGALLAALTAACASDDEAVETDVAPIVEPGDPAFERAP